MKKVTRYRDVSRPDVNLVKRMMRGGGGLMGGKICPLLILGPCPPITQKLTDSKVNLKVVWWKCQLVVPWFREHSEDSSPPRGLSSACKPQRYKPRPGGSRPKKRYCHIVFLWLFCIALDVVDKKEMKLITCILLWMAPQVPQHCPPVSPHPAL